MCDAFDTISSGSISAFNTVDSIQLMLGVLAVFRPSVLAIFSMLIVVQGSILRCAVALAAFQGFLLRENAGAIFYKKLKNVSCVQVFYKKLKNVSCEYDRVNG